MENLKIMNATTARAKLFGLIDEAAEYHQPVLITTKRKNAVLVSEEDWNSMQETLYLQSIPGLRESLEEGINAGEDELLSEEEFFRALEGDDDE